MALGFHQIFEFNLILASDAVQVARQELTEQMVEAIHEGAMGAEGVRVKGSEIAADSVRARLHLRAPACAGRGSPRGKEQNLAPAAFGVEGHQVGLERAEPKRKVLDDYQDGEKGAERA